jgi:LmbE family N-acetylglucosaminyl deacetylase
MLDAPVMAKKRRAINAHVSQVTTDGQTPAVLDQQTIERLLQPFELVFL